MAGQVAAPVDMLSQLGAARKLALADPSVYNQVVPGILPIIGPVAGIEVRRWGADFLAEAFASPSIPNTQKEQLCVDVLPVLKSYLDNPGEDAAVVKSVVQTAASIYPLVFRRVVSHPDQVQLWQDLTAIKLSILQRMDSWQIPIRICCVKFIQKVVQVETPGLIADPRRPDSNETSIALVPRNHPFLSLQNLEAEASGLLDRLLSIFQDNTSDPIMIDATLNCLAVLIRTRPAIANKILAAILNFNPLKQATAAMTPRSIVILKSMERTTRALLRYVMRIIPNNPLEQKIQAYLLRLQQSRTTFFSDSPSLKRPAEPTDGLNDAKRQRLTGSQRRVPPMPPPPNTLAQLFTLTEDPAIQQFDVKYLPLELIDFTIPLLLKSVPQDHLDDASNAVRARFNHLQKANLPTPIPDVPMAGPTGIDDEDEYDPEFDLSPDSAATNSTSENALDEFMQPAIELGPFELPKPPPLTRTEVSIVAEQSVDHVFNVVQTLDLVPAPTRQKVGFNRLAASANDRDAWITILIRLVTRTPSAIAEFDANTLAAESDKPENDEDSSALVKPDPDDPESPTVANRIRHKLFMYILDDFRARLNVAISWLSEEWYADKLTAKSNPQSAFPTQSPQIITPNYTLWTLRLLDRLLPYLDARDKNLLIRFLSEIPSITFPILELVAKQLARDPERIGMFVLAMQYLLMFRVPSREVVLGVLEQVWRQGEKEGDEGVKGAVGKVLRKWRPEVIERAVREGGEGELKKEREEVKVEGGEKGEVSA